VAWAEAYLHTKRHLDPSSHLATKHGPKSGGCCPLPFWGNGSPSNTMWPGLRPISIPRGILIQLAVSPQQTWAENWGLCPFGEGQLGPHVARARPTSMRSSGYIQMFGHNTPTKQTDTQTDRQRTDSKGQTVLKRSPKNE